MIQVTRLGFLFSNKKQTKKQKKQQQLAMCYLQGIMGNIQPCCYVFEPDGS